MKRRSLETKESPEDYLTKDPERFEVKFVNSRVGFGLFAKQSFQIGEFLLFYRGRKCHENDVKELNDYMFYMPSHKLYIDGSDPEEGGMARYINDEDQNPNARAVLHRLKNGEVMIALKCKTTIEKGDEIRYNYSNGNSNADCPWRSTRFSGSIIQCNIVPSQKNFNLKMFSQTRAINEHLKETSCQATEQDSNYSDDLYTSASEVTLGSFDTIVETDAIAAKQKRKTRSSSCREGSRSAGNHSDDLYTSASEVTLGSFDTIVETDAIAAKQKRKTRSSSCREGSRSAGNHSDDLYTSASEVTLGSFDTIVETDAIAAKQKRKTRSSSCREGSRSAGNHSDDLYTSASDRLVEIDEVETTSQVESTSKVEQATQVESEDSDHSCQTNSETDSPKQGFAKCNSNQESEKGIDQESNKGVDDGTFDRLVESASCGFCKQSFSSQKDVVKHFLLQKCTQRFLYIDPFHIPCFCCLRCGAVFLTLNLFVIRNHLRTNHSETPEFSHEDGQGNFGEMSFECDVIREVVNENGFDSVSDSVEEPSFNEQLEEQVEPVQGSSNSNRVLEKTTKSEKSHPRKSPHSIKCQLCLKILHNHLCLPKHLRRFHSSSNEKFINAIVKMHYFEQKKKGTTKCIYICLTEGCYKVFHRKDKHQIVDHQKHIKAIRKVTDLPNYILGEGALKTRDELDQQVENLRGFNFSDFLKRWKEEKEIDYDEGKGARRYAADRLPGLLKKIKIFLIMTDGLSDATVVASFFLKLKTEMKVKAGQSQAQICRELKDFIEFCRLGCPPSVTGFSLKCDQTLRSLQRQISKANKEVPCRIAANHEFLEGTIATVEEIDEVFRVISAFLYKTLHFFENLAPGSYISWEDKKYNGIKYTKLYKLLQCCLLFLICCRNVTRISSALYIRKEYLENLKFSSKRRVYTFKCIDENILRKLKSEKKAGIRELRDQLTAEIKNTNKNARREGIKCLALSETELFCFVRYLRLKRKFGVGHQSLLFLMLDQETEKIRRNVMGKWNKYLESFLKLPIAINTNAWRKNLCTLFAKEVGDLESERSLDRHIGHSRKVAQIHYEIIQKETDAIMVSEAVDRVIKVCQDGTHDVNFSVVS